MGAYVRTRVFGKCDIPFACNPGNILPYSKKSLARLWIVTQCMSPKICNDLKNIDQILFIDLHGFFSFATTVRGATQEVVFGNVDCDIWFVWFGPLDLDWAAVVGPATTGIHMFVWLGSWGIFGLVEEDNLGRLVDD
ncbi:hypothetical protein L1987_05639 [Smallanthus sonchifolius]|uniref:Uncharacterized protein n=1 Tax=Smallanthus sonchifolius TaxID=185202 RepID=A0ACB9JVW9_9ASTR|nr:hypothetical protein L1987_05639 [Smallanthus sonchifolius]